jgi:hypothetical protein
MLLCTGTGVTRNPIFYFNAKGIEARTNPEVTAIAGGQDGVMNDCLTGRRNTRIHMLVIATVPFRVASVPGTELVVLPLSNP